MATLSLERVSKRFNRHLAVNDLSLHVADGEFISLLGPSGCGKSTTLNLVCGLEQVDAGHIWIDDQQVTQLEPKDRDIAMVFQNYALYPHMTVYQNLEFPLKPRRVPPATRAKRIEEVAKALDLSALLERYPRQLSGGQQQRVALGRAMVRSPKLFLMDEPLSNLDAKLRIQMRAELRHLHETLRITTLYVTHDQAEAMILSDKIAVLNNGVLQQFASPREVYDQPANSFVAGFVGSYPMNFIRGTLQAGSTPTIITASGEIALLPHQATQLSEQLSDREVLVGIRPEKSRVRLQPTEGALQGQIYVVEQLGSDALVDIELADTRVRARAQPTFRGKVGQQVWFSLPTEHLYLFDATSGKTLVFPEPHDDDVDEVESQQWIA